MSNANAQGKIRIYDLARDLGRDNRDVMAVCQRLGIPHKTHSSTISEQEAEMIREALQRGLPPGGRKQAKLQQQGSNAAARQQILEVRRPPVGYQPPVKAEILPSTVTPPPKPPIQAIPEIEIVQPPVRPTEAPRQPEPTPAEPVEVTPRVEAEPVAVSNQPVEPAAPERTPVIDMTISVPVAPPPESPAPTPEPVVARSAEEVPSAPAPAAEPPVAREDAPQPRPAVRQGEPERPRPVQQPQRPTAGEPERRGGPQPPAQPTGNRIERRGGGPVVTPKSQQQPARPTAAQPAAPVPNRGNNQGAGGRGKGGPTKNIGGAGGGGGGGRNTQLRRRDDREAAAAVEQPKVLTLSGNIAVQELAERMKVATTEIIRTLFMRGVMVNINQTLDQNTAELVARELGFEVQTAKAAASNATKTEMLDVEDIESLQPRPPVVTIMGHVDHGKTSLLDAIRLTRVAEGEAGGITQHIGAYQVEVAGQEGERKLVFLDTPGHEAFTAMRARGARVTDITVLVVAADDGVKPQTVEAINHARAAGVPIVVAINKVDKPDANPDRVKQELTEYELIPEEWGGKTVMVPVSARQKLNLDLLLENILLVADYELELMANPNREARGTIIEAHLDKSRGPVATALVQNGTLRIGDTLVVGSIYGKVRALYDDRGNRVDAALPSMPVEVLGLTDVPQAGDEFQVYTDEREARRVADSRATTQRENRLQQQMASRSRVSLGAISAKAQEGELKELNIILRGDVQGSVEAIRASLEKLPQDKVQLRILQAAPGEVSETDIDLAAASNAVILAFSTTLASGARQAAEQAGVDVREYDIIYKLLEDVQLAMEGLLDPELIEEALGTAEVRAVFPVGKGQVAGCYVREGKLVRNAQIRIRRGKDIVFEGHVDSLKRFKEDAKEVATGFECGVGCDKFASWSVGDMIECFRMVTQKRTL